MNKFKQLLIAFLLSLNISWATAQTAMEIAPQMVPGWNLGNTLEAGPCTWLSNELDWETGWQPTKTSQKIIDYIRDLGFRSVRIPCAWYTHADQNHQISTAWMKRVKAVVDYCIKDSLYVLLNDHWDNGWIENSFKDISEENVSKNCEILRTLWTQIATEFADYNHHLLFAGLNEPNANDAATSAVLKRFNQTFVDAVRQTGGKNANRILVVQAPCTDIDLSYEFNVLPTDQTPNAMMLEVHFYAPYQFVLMTEDADWGKMAYYWGKNNHFSGSEHNATWGEESYISQQMRKLYIQYTHKNIPVIIGEFGGNWRIMPAGENQEKHDASIHDWYKTVCRYAVDNGAVPIVWDTNGCNRPSGTLVDRRNCTIFNQFAFDGIMEGVAEGTWPFATTGIESIHLSKPQSEEQPAYNLQGIPVSSDYRGLVIKNGKKILNLK